MKHIDWDVVRRHYDAGHTMRECKARFGFSNYAWDKAVTAGRIVPRENPRKQWRHDTRAAVGALLERGLTNAAIAQELGLSPPTVTYHARRLGHPRDERAARRYDWTTIQAAHDAGMSARECCAHFGCSRSAWHQAIERGRLKPRSHLIPLGELLVGDRRCGRDHLKRRLVRAGLKEERCEECGIDEWRGKRLRITLHHVNGDAYDNRLENLAFLCPNCHSQTPNFSGRNGHLRARPEGVSPGARFAPAGPRPGGRAADAHIGSDGADKEAAGVTAWKTALDRLKTKRRWIEASLVAQLGAIVSVGCLGADLFKS